MSKIKLLINNLLKQDPFLIKSNYKKNKLLKIFREHIKYHKKKCRSYNIWYKKNNFLDPNKINNFSDIPFLPSSIFKSHILKSLSSEYKIIQSSGSGGDKSNIYIDQNTSMLQRLALTNILKNLIGSQRKTFFIVDLPRSNDKPISKLSARYAGMSGYLMAAKETVYLLKLNKNNKIELNYAAIEKMKKKNLKEPIIIIGYTYMIWKYICENKKFHKINLNVNNDSKFIHFGGWKKISNKVNKIDFNNTLKTKLNIKKEFILDIYGFSEQLGSIYFSKGDGGNVVNGYSEVLVRDFDSLNVVQDGRIGYLQFLSVLPLSYPGFSILNDDIGYISKREKKNGFEYVEFKVLNRLERLEPRGCGDTLPNHFYA